MAANTITQAVYEQVLKRNPGEAEFHQAVKEVLGAQRAQEKAKQEQTLTAVGNLSDLLRPFSRKQERVFNLFYYMNLYGGMRFVDWLYEHYNPALETLEIS